MKKKIFSILLIAVLVLSSFATVFADTTTEHTITVTDNQNGLHTYTAYQVFKGTLKADGTLEGITWGNGVNSATLAAELQANDNGDYKDNPFGDVFKDCTDAPSFAKVISELSEQKQQELADVIKKHVATKAGEATAVKADDKNKAEIKVVGDGWYFVEDTTKPENMGKGDALSDYMLKVVDDIDVAAKSDTVSSDKKVKDKDDTTGQESDWQDVADYDAASATNAEGQKVGDAVPFRLHGTVATDYDKYTKYTYVFHDKQSAGLDKPELSTFVVTYANQDKSTGTLERGTDYTVVFDPDDGDTFDVIFGGENGLKDIAGIKAGADIYVEYKSVLNKDAVHGVEGNPNEMCLEYSNNPNDGGDGTGRTPDDKVIVFTFKIVSHKVGDDNIQPLKGAAFSLYKKVPEGTAGAVQLKEFDNVAKGTFKDTNIDGYYLLIKEFTAGDTTDFEFTGKDAGEYLLRETTIPTGYNGVDDHTFKITATYDQTKEPPELTGLTIDNNKFNMIVDEDANVTAEDMVGFETTIQNKSGSILPETGGMGTTIIYILGAALVIGAGVVLVSRKRSNDR